MKILSTSAPRVKTRTGQDTTGPAKNRSEVFQERSRSLIGADSGLNTDSDTSSCTRPNTPSWWTEKAALILNVPRRVEQSKPAVISAAFCVHREPPTVKTLNRRVVSSNKRSGHQP